MSVFKKLSTPQYDLRTSIAMSFEAAQSELLLEQQEVQQLNDELQKTIQVKDAVELVSNSLDPNDENYGVAMEAIFIASGLTLPTELLAPSFEAEDKKADADEKKKGFVKRAWEAIKAFFKKLYEGFLRLIGRKKKVAEAIKNTAEEMVKDSEKKGSDGGKEGEYQSKDEPEVEAPRGANGNATMAGINSKEFADNAPRIMKELAVGYLGLIEGMKNDSIDLQEAQITDPSEFMTKTGMDKVGFTVKGVHGKDFSAKFVVQGKRIAAEVKNPTDFQAVKYDALSTAEVKKLGEEMIIHADKHMELYAKFDEVKKSFDQLIKLIDEAIKENKVSDPTDREAAELAVSFFRAVTAIYTKDPLTSIGQALSIIRNISVDKPTAGTAHNGQRALTHSPA